jgi:hypothetical protein
MQNMTDHAVMVMNFEFVNGLIVLAFLVLGTVSITLLSGWALKRFGPPKE